MKVFADFNAPTLAPAFPDDIPEYGSIKTALRAFERFVENQSRYTEASECTGYLYFGHPGACSNYPDRVLTVGPRGGVRISRG